jgi:hypothetical protein
MAKSKATDHLTIRGLSSDDQAWLKAESERLGCDPENLVRMMIRQRMVSTPEPPTTGGGYREPYYEQPTHRAYNGAAAHDQPDPPLAPEVDVPADPDGGEPTLDQIMAAPPPFVDKPAPPRSRQPYISAGHGSRYQQRQTPSRNNIVPISPIYAGGAFGAFSLTQPLGLSESAPRGNMMGDAAGNIMRDNFRHFGFSGSRRG